MIPSPLLFHGGGEKIRAARDRTFRMKAS